jgi:sugar phosphate isomerase/epimerase
MSTPGRSAPPGWWKRPFDELARRWTPILNHAEDCGVDVCYEIHPGEDLHDGISYEMFLERTGNHARACMLYDPSALCPSAPGLSGKHRHLPRPHPHVPRQGCRVEPDRSAGRLWRLSVLGEPRRAVPVLGDGQVDFGGVFSRS